MDHFFDHCNRDVGVSQRANRFVGKNLVDKVLTGIDQQQTSMSQPVRWNKTRECNLCRHCIPPVLQTTPGLSTPRRTALSHKNSKTINDRQGQSAGRTDRDPEIDRHEVKQPGKQLHMCTAFAAAATSSFNGSSLEDASESTHSRYASFVSSSLGAATIRPLMYVSKDCALHFLFTE